MPENFSYILPGKLAGSAKPGRFGDLASDLSGLSRQGIGAIVSLTEEKLDAKVLKNFNFRVLHLPVADFTAPSMRQMARFVDFVDECLAEGVAVAVHCGAGIGRTGTMLACYLISQGMKPADAVRKIRSDRPGSIETREQEQVLERFYNQVGMR